MVMFVIEGWTLAGWVPVATTATYPQGFLRRAVGRWRARTVSPPPADAPAGEVANYFGGCATYPAVPATRTAVVGE